MTTVTVRLATNTFTVTALSPSTPVLDFVASCSAQHSSDLPPPELSRYILTGRPLNPVGATLGDYGLPVDDPSSKVVMCFPRKTPKPLPTTATAADTVSATTSSSLSSSSLASVDSVVSIAGCSVECALAALTLSSFSLEGALERVFGRREEIKEAKREEALAEGVVIVDGTGDIDGREEDDLVEEEFQRQFEEIKTENSKSGGGNSGGGGVVGEMFLAAFGEVEKQKQKQKQKELTNSGTTAADDQAIDGAAVDNNSGDGVLPSLLSASADANADLDDNDDDDNDEEKRPTTSSSRPSSPSNLDSFLSSSNSASDKIKYSEDASLQGDNTSLQGSVLSDSSSVLLAREAEEANSFDVESLVSEIHLEGIRELGEGDIMVPTRELVEDIYRGLHGEGIRGEVDRVVDVVLNAVRKERVSTADVTKNVTRNQGAGIESQSRHVRVLVQKGRGVTVVEVRGMAGEGEEAFKGALREVEVWGKVYHGGKMFGDGGVGNYDGEDFGNSNRKKSNAVKPKRKPVKLPKGLPKGGVPKKSSTEQGSVLRGVFDPKETDYTLPMIGYSLDFDPSENGDNKSSKDRGSKKIVSIVTPFANNGTVADKVNSMGRLSEVDVLRWVRSLCNSVGKMHEKSVICGGICGEGVGLTNVIRRIEDFNGVSSTGLEEYEVIVESCLSPCWSTVAATSSTKRTILLSMRDDLYLPPEFLSSTIASEDIRNKCLVVTDENKYKVDVWGFGCLLFELVTKKSLKITGVGLGEMEPGEIVKLVPGRYGDVLKHLLRRALKVDVKHRAGFDEIVTVLDQRINALEELKHPGLKAKKSEEDLEIKLTKKQLLELGRKAKREKKLKRSSPKKHRNVNGKNEDSDDEIDLLSLDESLASADGKSITSVNSSKIREKLMQQIAEAKEIQTAEGWEKTKERVRKSHKIRWWNSLSDNDRRIFLHKKECRRVHAIHVSRRKISKKTALLSWWNPPFLSVYFGYIISHLEKDGFIAKMKSHLLQLKIDEVNAKMYRPKITNDDDSSIASVSTVSKFTEVDDASVSSLMKKINLTDLENGLLDKKLESFSFGIPVYEPFDGAMEVDNGEYFVMSQVNPLIEQVRRAEEKRKRDIELGLLQEDGTESEAQKALRMQKKAKLNWKGAGLKVKMAVALNADVKRMQAGSEDRFAEELKKAEREAALALEKGEIDEDKEPPCYILGCSYADAFGEAMEWAKFSGKKFIEMMDECDEQAEIVMERMREQSILTDASSQILVKNNNVARFVSKNELMGKVLERAIRTAEMPQIPGHDDPKVRETLTRIQSISQLRRDDVEEESGKMKFSKLEMLNQVTILSFCLQRGFERLMEIVREGQFNAAAYIQARFRGKKVRAIMARVKLEAARLTAEKVKMEEEAKNRQMLEELKRKLTPPLIPFVSDMHSRSLVLNMPQIIKELGSWGHFGYKLDSHIRQPTEQQEANANGNSFYGDITILMSVASRSKMGKTTHMKLIQHAEEKKEIDISDDSIVVSGLKPDSEYRVYLRILPSCMDAMIAAMTKHHDDGIKNIEEGKRIKAEKIARQNSEKAMENMKKGMAALLGVGGGGVEGVDKNGDVLDKERQIRLEECGKRAFEKTMSSLSLVAEEEELNSPLFLKLRHYIELLGDANHSHLNMWREIKTKCARPDKCVGVQGSVTWVMQIEGEPGNDGGIIKVNDLLSKGLLGGKDATKTEKAPRISIKWTIPECNGHKITNFVVAKWIEGTSTTTTDTSSKEQILYTTGCQLIDAVHAGDGVGADRNEEVVYNYKVAAINRVGQGEWSNTVTCRVIRPQDQEGGDTNTNASEFLPNHPAKKDADGIGIGHGEDVGRVRFIPPPIPTTNTNNIVLGSGILLPGANLKLDYAKLKKGAKRKVQRVKK